MLLEELYMGSNKIRKVENIGNILVIMEFDDGRSIPRSRSDNFGATKTARPSTGNRDCIVIVVIFTATGKKRQGK